jgi:hypothetical protein
MSDDLGLEELYPVPDFGALDAAIAEAERDLPVGTPVSWRNAASAVSLSPPLRGTLRRRSHAKGAV